MTLLRQRLLRSTKYAAMSSQQFARGDKPRGQIAALSSIESPGRPHPHTANMAKKPG
jgi:hypothetical protein